jgi:hypothetical protein
MAHVTQVTEVKNFQRSNLTAPINTVIPVRPITTTQPVAASGSTVMGTSLNYMKLKLLSSTTDALTVCVWGWSYCGTNGGYWIPQLIATVTTTQATASQVPPTLGTLYEVSTYVLTSGDAKLFNTPATATQGAFILVDTVGCQFLEVYATTSSASTAADVYVFSSGL